MCFIPSDWEFTTSVLRVCFNRLCAYVYLRLLAYILKEEPTRWYLLKNLCAFLLFFNPHVLGCGKRQLWEALTSLGKFYNKDHRVLFWHRASSVQDHWLNVTRGGCFFFPMENYGGMKNFQSTYPTFSDAGSSKWRFIWKIPYYLNVTILVVTGILGCILYGLCRAPSSRVAKWHQRHLEASRIIRPMARALEFLGHEKLRCEKNQKLLLPQAKTSSNQSLIGEFWSFL